MTGRIERAARALLKVRYPSPDTPWEALSPAVQEQARQEVLAVSRALCEAPAEPRELERTAVVLYITLQQLEPTDERDWTEIDDAERAKFMKLAEAVHPAFVTVQ